MPDSTFNFHLEETNLLPAVTLTDDPVLSEAPWYVPGAHTITVNGIDPIPLPYSLRHDDGVGATAFLAVVSLFIIFGNSWRYLHNAVSDFFYPRDHANIYEEHTPDTYMSGGILLWLLATLSLGLAAYAFQSHHTPTALAISLTAAGVAWILKIAAYATANYAFFEDRQRATWRKGFKFLTLLESMALLAVSSMVIYLGTSPTIAFVISLLALGLIKILLLIKTQQTFGEACTSPLHLFLYFCTLEFAPLVIAYTLIA